ncbi:hypothetical protein ACHAWU_008336 [Discostella pseudostelligera]|uniref:Uncharacterized protein n=1 Tax=Discostella pseudostelligera TaxID=259834 RepID=A0ABD3M4N5_9STRA
MDDNTDHAATLDTTEETSASDDFAGHPEQQKDGGNRRGTADTRNKAEEDTLANRYDEDTQDVPPDERPHGVDESSSREF